MNYLKYCSRCGSGFRTTQYRNYYCATCKAKYNRIYYKRKKGNQMI